MLIDKILFSDKVPLILKKNLDALSDRHLLVSGNISNVNTPGYKAHDIDFQKQLREVVGATGDDNVKLRATSAKHFGPSKEAISSLEPEIFEDEAVARSNGNNVDIDKEMAKLAENQIMYSAIAQLMTKRGSTVRAAISESATS